MALHSLPACLAVHCSIKEKLHVVNSCFPPLLSACGSISGELKVPWNESFEDNGSKVYKDFKASLDITVSNFVIILPGSRSYKQDDSSVVIN